MLRKIFAYPLFLFTLIVLFVSINLFAMFRVIGNKENIKYWIESSGVYENATDIAIDYYLEQLYKTAVESGEDIYAYFPLAQFTTESQFRDGAKKIFPTSWIKLETEKNIDSLYLYLNGDSEIFKVDVAFGNRESSARLVLTKMMKDYFGELPDCDPAVQVAPEDYELFTRDCMPVSIGRDTVFKYIDSELGQSNPIEESGIASAFQAGLSQGLKPAAGYYLMFKAISYLALGVSVVSTSVLYFVVKKGKYRHKFMRALYLSEILMSLMVVIFAKLRLSSIFTNWISAGFGNGAAATQTVGPIMNNAVSVYIKELLIINTLFALAYYIHHRFVKSKSMDYVAYLDKFYITIAVIFLVVSLKYIRVLTYLRLGIQR